MTRPMVVDTFMFNREVDVLYCRLVEIGDVVDYVVIVEAEVDHQDHAKPLYFAENRERFAPWKDKIVHVIATDLPTAKDQPDPWAREHGQREHTAKGLAEIGVPSDAVILHGDCDEIPTVVAARNVRPHGIVAFDMACYSMAVDWQHPERWRGTVACRAGHVQSFARLRDARFTAPFLPDAGWHLGWLGDREERLAKLGAFAHPEIRERTEAGLVDDRFWREGWHVNGEKLLPVDVVPGRWPKWVADRECPESWWRPR